MRDTSERKARAARQERVSKVVWGLVLIALGVLLTLDNLDLIDLGRQPPPHPANLAVDGNPATRWSSGWSSPQWLEIDLGATVAVTRVKLNWENAHARDYQVQVSNDASNWTTVVNVSDSHGGVDERELSASGRYVRLYGTRRATSYGYSLWEFEVYGVAPGEAAARLLSQGKPVTASSLETPPRWPFFWFLYWPLFLVALGLPAVLVPKTDGDHVWGMFLTATGVVMQLHNLHFTPWGFTEWVPVLLVLAGAMLVVQSLRRAQASAGRSDDGPQGGAL